MAPSQAMRLTGSRFQDASAPSPDAAFHEVYRLTREANLGVTTAVRALVRELERLNRALSANRIHEDAVARGLFIDATPSLRGVHADLSELARAHPELRSPMDRVFIATLRDEWQRQPTHVTKTFEAFIRGITYFADQQPDPTAAVRHPLYHRLFACGDGSQAFRTTYLRCRDVMGEHERDDVNARIRRCYIERLIYDRIYVQQGMRVPVTSPGDVPRSQDAGHTRHLRESTEVDFQTCFPGIRLRVDVQFGVRDMPVACRITRLRTDGATPVATSTEVFRRTVVADDENGPWGAHLTYAPVVDCVRVTHGGRTYGKAQSFEREQPWKEAVRMPATEAALDWGAWASMDDNAYPYGAASAQDTYAPHRSRTAGHRAASAPRFIAEPAE